MHVYTLSALLKSVILLAKLRMGKCKRRERACVGSSMSYEHDKFKIVINHYKPITREWADILHLVKRRTEMGNR